MNIFIATVFLQKKNYVHIQKHSTKNIYIYIYVVTQILSSERRVYIVT